MGCGQAAKGRGARKGGFGTSISSGGLGRPSNRNGIGTSVSSGGNAQRGSIPMAMGGGQLGMRGAGSPHRRSHAGNDGIPGGEVARDEAITQFLSTKRLRASPLEGIEFEVISVLVYEVRM